MKTLNEYEQLCTKSALSFLCSRMPSSFDLHRSDWVFLLIDFQDKKGDDALRGLAGFYLYVINKDIEDKKDKIYETFAHDLSERDKPLSLPRSLDYKDVWKEEFDKYNYQKLNIEP